MPQPIIDSWWYPSVEALCDRHEGLVRMLGRTYAKPGSVLLNSWDLQQQLRLTLVDVWSRHADKVKPQVDRIVRTALRRTVGNLFSREARLARGDAAAIMLTLDLSSMGRAQEMADGLTQLFEAYFEEELVANLSDISLAVLWDLTHPPVRLQRAMLESRLVGGGIQPIARYFGLSPWMLRSALSEIRHAFSSFFDLPVKNLSLVYLYR